MHIVIAPDKFKGSLTGWQAAEAIRNGFVRVFPSATFDLLPLADGGEGILEAFKGAASGTIMESNVLDANGRQVTAQWLLAEIEGRRTAVIESSQANGLWRIPMDERDLSRASSYGVGQLIRAAAEGRVDEILIGLGGSATNDAGLGLAAALGTKFLDANGNELEPIPRHIPAIASIDSSGVLSLPIITVACDVENPLLGSRGATQVYGPQKGLKPEEAESAEAAHAHLVEICGNHYETQYAETPGAGAAGGLGFGLMTFCGATLASGFDCIAHALCADEKISAADLVITAEGSLDHQTLEGKTPHGVSKLARKHNLPVYAIAGRLADEDLLHQHFHGITSIVNGPMTLDEAIANAPLLLELAATRLAHIISNTKI